MALSGRAWPAHPKPLDDELLSSWLVRTARANGLKLQTFCDTVFGKEDQLWNRDIDRSAPEWLQAAMSEHTGTSQERVRQTTLDIYRGRIYHRRNTTGQLQWILSAGIYHRTRRYFGMQFCPQCLAEDEEPYFRTRWRVAALTFCAEHKLHLHDRCPSCAVPIAFHRRELGRPEVTDPGLLCQCNVCDFDLRYAEAKSFAPYEQNIATRLTSLAAYVSGANDSIDIDHMDVLHQLCKVMTGMRGRCRLAAFVADAIGTANFDIPHGHRTFESRPVEQRAHLIQLAVWLLADPRVRLLAAWQARAVRYNYLVRDFPSSPGWYCSITDLLNRR